MNVAELFVNLGVKGADKSVTAIKDVRASLADVTSTSLATKAAMVGIFYELQQLTAQSNAFGASIQVFTNLTGLSGDKLQRWQYLMRQAHVSANETTQGIEALQRTMTNVVLNHGNPEGMTALGNTLGKNFDPSRIRDTMYMMDKLREYARTTKDVPDVANAILRSFIPNDNIIQALRTSEVDLNKINPKELYSDSEIEQLGKMSVGWDNLGNHIEKAIGRLNVQFGPTMLEDISQVTDSIIDLTAAFAKLTLQLHALEGLNYILKGWATLLDFGSELIDDVSSGALSGQTLKNVIKSNPFETNVPGPRPQGLMGAVHTGGNITNSIENNITVTMGENDAQAVGAAIGIHVGKMTNDAFRQIQQGGQ